MKNRISCQERRKGQRRWSIPIKWNIRFKGGLSMQVAKHCFPSDEFKRNPGTVWKNGIFKWTFFRWENNHWPLWLSGQMIWNLFSEWYSCFITAKKEKLCNDQRTFSFSHGQSLDSGFLVFYYCPTYPFTRKFYIYKKKTKEKIAKMQTFLFIYEFSQHYFL